MSPAANAATSTNNRSNDNSTLEGHLQVGLQPDFRMISPAAACYMLSLQ